MHISDGRWRRTLSRERPGGRDGEEGSSRPRGFFGLGGAASDTSAAAAVVVEVDRAGGGATRSEGHKAGGKSQPATQLAVHGWTLVLHLYWLPLTGRLVLYYVHTL